jgi:hypothetical protein
MRRTLLIGALLLSAAAYAALPDRQTRMKEKGERRIAEIESTELRIERYR